ncbi:hypothetical protein Tco_0937579 [Tanacetum coccineum]|uniref:Uncharacterized protein n=1 Tax=Tanacetum coccineum TaxID=301880 RepID=A0ABQ5DFE4_9ASTR
MPLASTTQLTALTLACSDAISCSDDTSIALDASNSCLIVSSLMRGISSRCSYISPIISLWSSNLALTAVSVGTSCCTLDDTPLTLLRCGDSSGAGENYTAGAGGVYDLHLLRDSLTNGGGESKADDGDEYIKTLRLLRGGADEDACDVADEYSDDGGGDSTGDDGGGDAIIH